MSRYSIHFEWPLGASVEHSTRLELHAGTLELAKMQAAMLYAGAAFEIRPTAYRIFQNGETEVYRYPEATKH